MQIRTINHDFENDVRDILYLFFARHSDVRAISILATPQIHSQKPKLASEGQGIFVGVCAVNTILFFEGKQVQYNASRMVTSLFELKYLIKMSAFFAARQLSENGTPWGMLTGIRPVKFFTELTGGGSLALAQEILCTDYLVTPQKARLCSVVAEVERELLSNIPNNAVCVYVGIPFCPGKCLYCSFVSEKVEKAYRYMGEYVSLLLKEMEILAEYIRGRGKKIVAVYVGGGTPTSLNEGLLDNVCNAVSKHFPASEFTVEAGRADTINEKKLSIIANSGATRLCINPQTMNDATLIKIRRGHTVEQFERAFFLARLSGFNSINCDLIAGLPGEGVSQFQNSLDLLAKHCPESVTCHTLHYKRASSLADRSLNVCSQTVEQCLERGEQFAKQNKMRPYYLYRQKSSLGNLENLAYAKVGHESLYNMLIMREQTPIYAVGAGGSSKLVKNGRIERFFNPKYAVDYIRMFDDFVERKMLMYEKF